MRALLAHITERFVQHIALEAGVRGPLSAADRRTAALTKE